MSDSVSIAVANVSFSALDSRGGSRLASNAADAIASRFVAALSRVPYFAAITSPCSVIRIRPCTVPVGCARIAANAEPPPRPTAPPRPWNSCMPTPAFSNTGFSAVDAFERLQVEVR